MAPKLSFALSSVTAGISNYALLDNWHFNVIVCYTLVSLRRGGVSLIGPRQNNKTNFVQTHKHSSSIAENKARQI